MPERCWQPSERGPASARQDSRYAGLDPDMTLQNALYRLDRVATKRAADAKLPETKVRLMIEMMLQAQAVGSYRRVGRNTAGERVGSEPGFAGRRR